GLRLRVSESSRSYPPSTDALWTSTATSRRSRFTRLSTGGLDEDRRCSGYRHHFYGSYGGGAADQPGELMDRTFFATCPECRSPGPHHASFHEYVPPPPNYPVQTEEIVSFTGRATRSYVVDDGSIPESTDYTCTVRGTRWPEYQNQHMCKGVLRGSLFHA